VVADSRARADAVSEIPATKPERTAANAAPEAKKAAAAASLSASDAKVASAPPASDSSRVAAAPAAPPSGSVQGRGATGALGAAAGASPQSAGRRIGSQVMQLQEIVTTGTGEPRRDFLGCYQLTVDSAGARLGLPRQFMLERTLQEGAMQNVVRGTRREPSDTGVLGTWRPLGPGVVNVSLSAGPSLQTLMLTDGAGGLAASLTSTRPPTTVPVAKTPCPR
jgi:hypothetical protein